MPQPIIDKLPTVDADFVLDILESLFDQEFKGKTVAEVLDSWLDVALDIAEDCLNLDVSKPAVSNFNFLKLIKTCFEVTDVLGSYA